MSRSFLSLFLSLVTIFIVSSGTAFAELNEETCKQQVDSTITAFDAWEQQTGQKQSMNGLTKQEIVEMLKTMTYCEVMQEINKHSIVK